MKTTAFFAWLAICFLVSLLPMNALEERIYSWRMELRGHTGAVSNVVILDLNQADFNSLKRQTGADTNPALKRPEVLRMDALRDHYQWNPDVFSFLTKHLLEKNPVAIVVSWPIPSSILHSLPSPVLHELEANEKLIWVTPQSIRFDEDDDGIVRRSAFPPGDRSSIAGILSGKVSADPRARRELINYSGPPGSVPRCRLLDALEAEPSLKPCPDLTGKTIILAHDGDSVRTPFGHMPAAEVIANEIQTALSEKPVRIASFPTRALVLLGLVILGACYVIFYPVLISFIALFGTGFAIIIVLFQIIFQLAGLYLPATNATLALLATYIVFTGYRLAVQENLHWRWLEQTQYLKELDKMKTNVLSLLSHDLKTPLAKIQAVVERFRREVNECGNHPDWLKLLDSIENSNNELKHYITSILNLSKVESQKVILNKKSNDINQLIQKTIRRLRRLWQGRNITIEQSLDPLFSVECDEDLMAQVLTNLIDNAIKYSPEGGKVIVRSREEEGSIRVEVEDFGPGIPKDKLPLMFRRFSRFLRPIDEKVKGTGLGLYLSKYFIELHGGKIQVRSVEGEGTTFTFTLPLHTEPAQRSSPS